MRPLLLASAAFFFSTGLALAQTTSPSPAPTGAPNGPVQTPPGASPGNTTPNTQNSMSNMSSGSTSQSMSNGANNSMSSPSPAPEGAPQAAPTSPTGTTPGKSAPGNPNKSSSISAQPSPGNAPSSTGTTAMSASNPGAGSHYGAGVSKLPASGSANSYLRLAAAAIKHHDKSRADDALSHAETRLLTRSVPQSSTTLADSSPAVASIESARAALRSGNYTLAASDTYQAMHRQHGGMGHASDASTATP